MFKKQVLFTSSILLIFTLISCKKETPVGPTTEPPTTEPPTTGVATFTGNLEDGIYLPPLEPPYMRYYEKIGSGAIKVVISDLYGAQPVDPASHGARVRGVFFHYVNPADVTVYSFGGSSSDSFNAIKTNEKIIVSASAHEGGTDEIIQKSLDDAQILKNINVLYLAALENIGVDGMLDSAGNPTAYTYPHPGNAYTIVDVPEALAKTIFVAYYDARDSTGGVDLHGGFVDDNIDDVVFVSLPSDFAYQTVDGTATATAARVTSFATPYLASYAARLLAAEPSLTIEQLKTKIISLGEKKLVNILDTELTTDADGKPVETGLKSFPRTVTVLTIPDGS